MTTTSSSVQVNPRRDVRPDRGVPNDSPERFNALGKSPLRGPAASLLSLIIVSLFPVLVLLKSSPTVHETLINQLIGSVCIVMHLILCVKNPADRSKSGAAFETLKEYLLFGGLGAFYPTPLVWLFLLLCWLWTRLNTANTSHGASRTELLHLLGYGQPSLQSSTTDDPPASPLALRLPLAFSAVALLHVALRAAGHASEISEAAPLMVFTWHIASAPYAQPKRFPQIDRSSKR